MLQQPQTLSADKSPKRWLTAGAIIIALETIGFWLLEFSLNDGLLSRDGYSYLSFVEDVLESNWSEALTKFPQMKHCPPLLMIMMYYCSGICPPELCGLGLNLLGTVLTGLGVWFCAYELYQRPGTALASALIVMALPKIYMTGCDIMRDPLYWAAMIWIVYFSIRLLDNFQAQRPSLKRWRKLILLLAVLSGVSILTRKEGVPLTVITAILVFVITIKSKFLPLKSKMIWLFMCSAIVIAAAFLPLMLGYDWQLWSLLETRISIGGRI